MNVRIEEIELLISEYADLNEVELRKRLLHLVNQHKTLKLLIPVSG